MFPFGREESKRKRRKQKSPSAFFSPSKCWDYGTKVEHNSSPSPQTHSHSHHHQSHFRILSKSTSSLLPPSQTQSTICSFCCWADQSSFFALSQVDNWTQTGFRLSLQLFSTKYPLIQISNTRKHSISTISFRYFVLLYVNVYIKSRVSGNSGNFDQFVST